MGRLCTFRAFRCRFSLQRHLPFRFRLVSCARVGGGQLVVTGRISRLHLYIALQRRDRVRELPCLVQRHPERQVCLLKSFIELRRSRKMPDGFFPLPSLTSDLSQQELRRGVVGINLQFFFEFCVSSLGVRRRPRKKDSPETIVNARQPRFLLEDFFVFGDGFIPVFLRLESLCIELFSLMRGRSRRRQFLCRPRS